MKVEYYEDMLEQKAINKYLNMIANDYGGELAKIFKEKYINKDKEIERLNNIINELENEINIAIKELQPGELVNGINLLKNIKITLKELKGSESNE